MMRKVCLQMESSITCLKKVKAMFYVSITRFKNVLNLFNEAQESLEPNGRAFVKEIFAAKLNIHPDSYIINEMHS